MIAWDILVYISAGVCFVGAGAVLYGFVKHLAETKKQKEQSTDLSG